MKATFSVLALSGALLLTGLDALPASAQSSAPQPTAAYATFFDGVQAFHSRLGAGDGPAQSQTWVENWRNLADPTHGPQSPSVGQERSMSSSAGVETPSRPKARVD